MLIEDIKRGGCLRFQTASSKKPGMKVELIVTQIKRQLTQSLIRNLNNLHRFLNYIIVVQYIDCIYTTFQLNHIDC